MRYLLVVGFHCDVYRKEPQARIFVDNKLIDEFHIKHYITKYNHSNFHSLQPFSLEHLYNNIVNKAQSLLKFYEIELDEKQEKLNLSIYIDNNDSNTSNSFMTRSTTLKLKFFYLIPLNKKIFTRLIKISEKRITKENYAWFRRSQSGIHDLIYHTTWYGKNKQIIKHSGNTGITNNYIIGGSGHFSCDLIKKYKIFIPRMNKPYRFNIPKYLYNYFFDKYKQYANQGSTN